MKVKWYLNISGEIDLEKTMTKEAYKELLEMNEKHQDEYIGDFMWDEIKDHSAENYQYEIVKDSHRE